MDSGQQGKSFFWGLFFIGMGALLLLDIWDLLDFGYVIENFWPLILVFVGLQMLFKHKRKNKDHYNDINGNTVEINNHDAQYMRSDSNVFGDVQIRFDGKKVDDFSCNNVFGDISLDFSRADFEAISNIQVNGVFGDIEIILPRKINPEIHVNVSFGSMRVLGERRDGIFNQLNYSPPGQNSEYPSVKINASQVFGDVQVYYQN